MRPTVIGLRVLRLFGVVFFAVVAGVAIGASVFGPRQLVCLYQELERGDAREGVPCLKLSNQQVQAYLLRTAGDDYWRQNRLAEAASAYRRGARFDPTIADNLYAAGTQAMAAGNLASGIAYLTAYLDIPNVPKDKLYLARNLRRFAWEQQEKLNDALGNFAEAMGIPQVRPADYRRAGEVKDRWLQDALVELNAAIELEPTNDNTYWQRAGLRFDLGDLAGALQDSDAAIRLEPNKWQNVSRRATVLIKAQRADEAIKLVEDFEAHDGKSARTERLRGEILAGGGQFKPAKAALDRALALLPTDSYAFWLRGRINAQLGDLDAAIADTQRSRTLGFAGADGWLDAYTKQRGTLSAAARAR